MHYSRYEKQNQGVQSRTRPGKAGYSQQHLQGLVVILAGLMSNSFALKHCHLQHASQSLGKAEQVLTWKPPRGRARYANVLTDRRSDMLAFMLGSV
ncbi:MAG: hypothetical protein FRX49_02406 [Trebouxia sp. A1-2]|nr:MAG: hypothetical protein FRX49_02406 [Trebouxia sp. A1-2]